MDELSFTLSSPITEEQWDMISDVDLDNTNEITFHTKHGKEVKFVKAQPERKKGKWIIRDNPGTGWYRVTCSECGEDVTSTIPMIGFFPNAKPLWNYCPDCGAKMETEYETWNGICTQITAPKGTFDKIFNDNDTEDNGI